MGNKVTEKNKKRRKGVQKQQSKIQRQQVQMRANGGYSTQEKVRVPAAEDKVMKVAMQAFGENIMKYLGQTDQVKRVAPTEHVHLEMKQMYEDFNYEMLEGHWRHYEFESDRITITDMRRFREYEAFLSMTHNVPVITTVLCSADAKQLRSELTEGINTYKVETVRMKGENADNILATLQQKIDAGEQVSLDELIPMLLTPLMSGNTTVCDRILQGFGILKKVQGQFSAQDFRKMQSILYAFACKFLNGKELKKVKEEIGMTALGEMLMRDGFVKGEESGIAKGIEKGRSEGIRALILDNLEEGIKKDRILSKLVRRFDLTPEKAEMYFAKYSEE